MKKILLSRRELPMLIDALSGAATVLPGLGDDRDALRLFKYRVGRNLDFALSAQRATERACAALVEENPAWDEFVRQREEVAMQYAVRDTAGAAVMSTGQDGAHGVSIQFEKQGDYERDLAELENNFRDAIAARTANAKVLERHRETATELEVMTFPFADLPARLGGGYLARIRCMLDGVPQEPEWSTVAVEQWTMEQWTMEPDRLTRWQLFIRWLCRYITPVFVQAPAALEEAGRPDANENDGLARDAEKTAGVEKS